MDPTADLAPLAVLTASLLGSAHCAGMCGPFTLLLPKTRTAEALYHLGRLFSYTLLGMLAGFLGQAFFHSLPRAAASWVSAILMSAAFLISGLLLLRRRLGHLPPIPGLSLIFQKIQSLHGNTKSLAIGTFSVLLPCGWLYGFLLGATATGSPLNGALFLGAFWLGTVPALSMAKNIIRFAPRIVAILLIIFGLAMIGMRINNAPEPHTHRAPQ